jgi:hypothetical protein
MKAVSPMRVAFLFLVAAALAALSGQAGFPPAPVGEAGARTIGSLVLVFLILAVLVERAVELVLSALYGRRAAEILAPVRRAANTRQAVSEFMRRDLEILPTPQDRLALISDEYRSAAQEGRRELSEAIVAAMRQLDALHLRKQRTALCLALALGFALSLAGFQILATLVGAPAGGAAGAQAVLLRAVDLALSTAALAGAAEGLHRLLVRVLGPRGSSLEEVLREHD